MSIPHSYCSAFIDTTTNPRKLFGTQQGSASRDQEASQFFSNTPQSSFVSKNAVDTALYDMKAMQAALPPQSLPVVQQQAPLASWAADFMRHEQQQPQLLQDVNLNLKNDLGLQRSPSVLGPNGLLNVCPLFSARFLIENTAGIQWTANLRTHSLPAFVPQVSHIQQQPSVTTGKIFSLDT